MEGAAGKEKITDTWTRKVGHGWRQPLTIGLGGLISSIVIISVMLVFMDRIGKTLFFIIILVLAFTLLCFAVGFSVFLSRDYYVHMAQTVVGRRDIPVDKMVRFVERFLKDNKIPYKKTKRVSEYVWSFTGEKNGHIFVITNGDLGLMLGIRDRDGDLMELVQTFVIEANVEFDLAPKEEWSDGYLD